MLLTKKDKEIIQNGTFMQQTEALIGHFEDEAWVKEAHTFLKMIMKLTEPQKEVLKLVTKKPRPMVDIIFESKHEYADRILLQLKKKGLVESSQMKIPGHKRTWLGYKRR